MIHRLRTILERHQVEDGSDAEYQLIYLLTSARDDPPASAQLGNREEEQSVELISINRSVRSNHREHLLASEMDIDQSHDSVDGHCASDTDGHNLSSVPLSAQGHTYSSDDDPPSVPICSRHRPESLDNVISTIHIA